MVLKSDKIEFFDHNSELDFSYSRREIRSVFGFVESVLSVSVWV